MSYFSHTDDTVPNSPSEETTSKCELPYPFVIKDYMIRNAVLNKLHKKIPLSEGEKNSICIRLVSPVFGHDGKAGKCGKMQKEKNRLEKLVSPREFSLSLPVHLPRNNLPGGISFISTEFLLFSGL